MLLSRSNRPSALLSRHDHTRVSQKKGMITQGCTRWTAPRTRTCRSCSIYTRPSHVLPKQKWIEQGKFLCIRGICDSDFYLFIVNVILQQRCLHCQKCTRKPIFHLDGAARAWTPGIMSITITCRGRGRNHHFLSIKNCQLSWIVLTMDCWRYYIHSFAKKKEEDTSIQWKSYHVFSLCIAHTWCSTLLYMSVPPWPFVMPWWGLFHCWYGQVCRKCLNRKLASWLSRWVLIWFWH
jgi:hypothetical protein